jgi:hypothetical protein
MFEVMEELRTDEGKRKFVAFCKQNPEFVVFLQKYVCDQNQIITAKTIRGMMKYYHADSGQETGEIGRYAATRALKLKQQSYNQPQLYSFKYVCEVYDAVRNNISHKAIYKQLRTAFALLSYVDIMWLTRFLTKQVNKYDVFYEVIKDARLCDKVPKV